MKLLNELYQRIYGEDYSRDVTKSININDLSDYTPVKPLSECTGKTIKGVYIDCRTEIFIVFTDKTYIHISIEDECDYGYNYCENFSYLVHPHYLEPGKYEYTATPLCDLLEIDKDYVVALQKEMDEADHDHKEDDEYRRYLELDKKYASRKAKEMNDAKK